MKDKPTPPEAEAKGIERNSETSLTNRGLRKFRRSSNITPPKKKRK